MSINNFLISEYKKIENKINKCDFKYYNNKLLQKKIEYIYFYIQNINEELDDIYYINNNNLLYNDNYINKEYNNYINIENTINFFQLTHNL